MCINDTGTHKGEHKHFNYNFVVNSSGRGGENATATIYYSASDIDHAGMWIKEHLHNFDHCNRILKEFGNAWQYVMSHLSGECRRKVFFESVWRGYGMQ